MSRKTVFVIGAGASVKAYLPDGEKLKKIIIESLYFKIGFQNRLEKGEFIIIDALQKQYNNDRSQFIHETDFIRDNLLYAISIDNFIDQNRNDNKIALIGKLAIVSAILSKERDSKLFFDKSNINDRLSFSSLNNTWYIPFFQLITENCAVDDLLIRFKDISLIIFNYDRCVEHFLFNAIQIYYENLSEKDATALVNKIKIYHPYGSVGNLPWQSGNTSIEYGKEIDSGTLLKLKDNIKTYAEGTNPNSSEIKQIKEQMRSADIVVFLGFAFHKQNMELIKPKEPKLIKFDSVKCYATTYGISDSNKDVISNQIKNLYSKKTKVEMLNTACYKFFQEYWRSLAF